MEIWKVILIILGVLFGMFVSLLLWGAIRRGDVEENE